MKQFLVPIHGFIKGSDTFPIQKWAIFCKFKEVKALRGGALLFAKQAIPDLSRQGVIDAEIVEKGHLWTETIYKIKGAVIRGRLTKIQVARQ